MAVVATRTVIEVENLAKRYRLGQLQAGYDTLRDSIAHGVNRMRGLEHLPPAETIWALRDVSFGVEQGEVMGVIGPNGAGKSTLLKILTRITSPTQGTATIRGRVGSLLEVGTGFHGELTGRENIYLNGSILGMTRREITRKLPEIVEFSGVSKFIDTPVKRYSSGMYVRLAFSVAAHLEPEILIVDEVLAVGDAAFQRKSLGKMGEVAREGRTVIFVSHNLAIIQALCSRGILLEGGRAIADAPVADAIDRYLRTLERAASDDLLSRTDRDGRGWEGSLIRGLEIRNAGGGQADVVVGGRPVKIVVEVTETLPMTECRLTIVNSLGQPVATLDSEVSAPADVRDGRLGPRIECDVDSLPLVPGRYRIDVVLKGRRQIQDGLQAAAFFDVEPGVLGERPMPVSGSDGDVVLAHRWRLPA